MIRRVYTFTDGSQLLVTSWLRDGEIHQEAATRAESHHTWSRPLVLTDTQDDPTDTYGLESREQRIIRP